MSRRREGEAPRLRPHPTGGSVVVLAGESIYCGPFGTPESRRRHAAAVLAWEARGRKPRPKRAQEATVAGLVAAFAAHVEASYRKRGTLSKGGERLIHAAKTFDTLAGDMAVADVTKGDVRSARDYWAAKGLARTTVNAMLGGLRQMFKWGSEEDLVPSTVLFEALAVQNLRRGRTAAPEPPPVRPIPAADLERILAAARPPLTALARFQLAAGLRPAEACAVRASLVDRSSTPWAYTIPAEWDKTGHVSQAPRVVYLGPRAREALGPALDRRPDNPWPNQYGRPYTPDGYYKGFRSVCVGLGIKASPNRLRHSAGTAARAGHGAEAARVLLGHRRLATTEIYAEVEDGTKRKLAEDFG
jgi:integrase